jgi:hypothetical protein
MFARQYDISKPIFDLYSCRQIRGDALAKYNSLNQSEPLRINLYALGMLIFLSAPTLSDEVNGVPLNVPQIGASVLGVAGCALLFLRECQKRSRQLKKLEKELAARDLLLRPPASLLADRPFSDAMSIRSIQEYGGGPRILALYCETNDKMQKVLKGLRVFGKRLKQANVLVVPVVKNGEQQTSDRSEWLATPEAPRQWEAYFDSISDDRNNRDIERISSSFKWFGLSSTGRSFGSGIGEVPSWLQVMGQHLRPMDIVDPEDKQSLYTGTENEIKVILGQQQHFYDALTNGKLEHLNSIFVRDNTKSVTDIVDQGGRLDSWKFCLEDGARPEGMKIGYADVVIESDTKAFSTCIEFPVADGLTDARLLAVQEWTRKDKKEDWKMVQHQTIPWSTDVAAAGTLICDCRGCVSLVRGSQKRTFVGLIG